VRERESVERARVPGVRLAVSGAGSEEERELPSNEIVGASGVVAKALTPRPNTPETAREIVRARATGLLETDSLRIGSPSALLAC
jgi:hypothetical protein